MLLAPHRPHALAGSHSQAWAGTASPALDNREPVVLVADDSLLARKAVRGILSQLDRLRIIEASDGREALEILDTESPTLVLTDILMPGLDGLGLIGEMKERFPHIPTIVMTAYGSEREAMRALRLGAANYVPKSELRNDLAETVRRVLAVTTANHRKMQARRFLCRREADFLIPSDPAMIPELVELLLEDLDATGGFEVGIRIRVGVALTEALTNAIYHGNLEVSSDLRQEDEREFYNLAQERRRISPYDDRRVRIHVRVDPREAVVEIADEGPGFDTSTLYLPIADEDLLRVGGRGMLLIRAFMDEVEHNAAGNRITMTKRF